MSMLADTSAPGRVPREQHHNYHGEDVPARKIRVMVVVVVLLAMGLLQGGAVSKAADSRAGVEAERAQPTHPCSSPGTRPG